MDKQEVQTLVQSMVNNIINKETDNIINAIMEKSNDNFKYDMYNDKVILSNKQFELICSLMVAGLDYGLYNSDYIKKVMEDIESIQLTNNAVNIINNAKAKYDYNGIINKAKENEKYKQMEEEINNKVVTDKPKEDKVIKREETAEEFLSNLLSTLADIVHEAETEEDCNCESCHCHNEDKNINNKHVKNDVNNKNINNEESESHPDFATEMLNLLRTVNKIHEDQWGSHSHKF